MSNIITIDDGTTLVVSTAVSANYVVKKGTLEVAAGGVITGVASASGVNATVTVEKDGVLNVKGGTITSEPGEGLFFSPVLVHSGQMTVQSGSVTANGGGTVGSAAITIEAVDSATVTIAGGAITGGAGQTSGGPGVSLKGSKGANHLIVSGGTISGGSARNSGGAGVMLGATVNSVNFVAISGGTIVGGQGRTIGGTAVYVSNQGSVSITGGTIGGNDGPVLQFFRDRNLTPCDLRLSGGRFSGPARIKPAIYMSASWGGLTIDGGEFSGKWQIDSGDAVVRGKNLVLANGTLSGTLAHGQAISVPVLLVHGGNLVLESS